MVRDLLQLNTLCKRLFIGLVAFFIVVCGTYGFLLKQTVASVVERKSLEAEKGELASRVSSLEADYIRAADKLTLSHAQELGFVTTKNVRFVSRASETFSVAYQNND